MSYSLLIFKEIMYEFNLPNEIKSKIMLYTDYEICIELGFYFEAKQLYKIIPIKVINVNLNTFIKEDKLKIFQWLHINKYIKNYLYNISDIDILFKNSNVGCLEIINKSEYKNFHNNGYVISTV